MGNKFTFCHDNLSVVLLIARPIKNLRLYETR